MPVSKDSGLYVYVQGSMMMRLMNFLQLMYAVDAIDFSIGLRQLYSVFFCLSFFSLLFFPFYLTDIKGSIFVCIRLLFDITYAVCGYS